MKSITVSIERRQLPDRRQPVSFWSSLRLHGRRRGFRRVGEGKNLYVDCPEPRVIILTLLVTLGSAVDAFFTLLYLQNGGSELNPVMRFTLNYSVTAFLGLKIGLTNLCAWFLAVHQQFPLAFRALHGLALVYLLLLGIHVGLVH